MIVIYDERFLDAVSIDCVCHLQPFTRYEKFVVPTFFRLVN